MGWQHLSVPEGTPLNMAGGHLNVPDRPVIGWIEGDGVGPDIWRALHPLFEKVVRHCYGERRQVAWMELYAGGKANERYGAHLPDETLDAIREYKVAIKGPLATPVGRGFRSLNVRIRQVLDLYACVRPVRYFNGVPSPVIRPELVDMVIFRENTEDVYCGMEVQAFSEAAQQMIAMCGREMGWEIRPDSGIGIKPISASGSKRLIRAALHYAIDHGRKSVTLVHKGNIMKYTEGAFMQWGYDLVREEFGDVAVAKDAHGGPGDKRIIVKDVIADNFLQMVLLNPWDYDIIATMNLNGDYISDSLAAQVGGIGIAPGANINYADGMAVFEATHGTAPKLADTDSANPCSVLLSAAMLFEYIGWEEAGETLVNALQRTFNDGIFTGDLAALKANTPAHSCCAFAAAVAERLGQ